MKVYMVIKYKKLDVGDCDSEIPDYAFSTLEEATKEQNRIKFEENVCAFVKSFEVVE